MKSIRWTSIAASFLLVLVVGCGADSEGDHPDTNATTDVGTTDVFTGGDATTTDTTDEQVTEEELDSAMAMACDFCFEQNPMRDCPNVQTVENLLKATVAMSTQLCGDVLVEEYDWLNGDFDCQVEGGGNARITCEVIDFGIECNRMFNHVPLDDAGLELFPQSKRFVRYTEVDQTECTRSTVPSSGW